MSLGAPFSREKKTGKGESALIAVRIGDSYITDADFRLAALLQGRSDAAAAGLTPAARSLPCALRWSGLALPWRDPSLALPAAATSAYGAQLGVVKNAVAASRARMCVPPARGFSQAIHHVTRDR